MMQPAWGRPEVAHLWVRTTQGAAWTDYGEAIDDLGPPDGLLDMFVTEDRSKVAVQWGDPWGPHVRSLGEKRRLQTLLSKRKEVDDRGLYLYFSLWSSGHPDHDVQPDQVSLAIENNGPDRTLLVDASVPLREADSLLQLCRYVIERWGATYGLSWGDPGQVPVPPNFANFNARYVLDLIAPSCVGAGWLVVLPEHVADRVSIPDGLDNPPIYHKVSGPDREYVIVQTAPTALELTDSDLTSWQCALASLVPDELTDFDVMMRTLADSARQSSEQGDSD